MSSEESKLEGEPKNSTRKSRTNVQTPHFVDFVEKSEGPNAETASIFPLAVPQNVLQLLFSIL